MKIIKSILALLLVASILTQCTSPKEKTEETKAQTVENKALSIVNKMVEKVGDYDLLKSKKDVIYTYRYTTPDGKFDHSTEKYIFDGELSYGYYHTHQRTFDDLVGNIEQGWDGNEYWLKHEGKIIDDKKRLQRVAFNRPTNYYWFAMIQKLNDPGLVYEYLGETNTDGNTYDIVKLSFEKQGDKASDIYQLYINKKTSLVDHFVFTVADFGVIEEPFIMKVEYEKIDDFYIPTNRKYKKSTWNADVSDDPWTEVKWTNIKFNNGLKKENFKKENQMENMDKSTSSLKSILDEKKQGFENSASDYKKKIYAEGIDAVANGGIIESAINVGDTAPNFTLMNATGKKVTLADELKKGPVVLTWYRGGWCPYCNLTLRALQDELPNFQAEGASLIAVSPELPDNSLTTVEKNNLEYEVVSDLDNKVAKEYGIVFELIEPVAESYNKSFNLVKFNGNDSNELPLAASYIINTDGKVIYAFLDADYRNRAEPSEILSYLKKR